MKVLTAGLLLAFVISASSFDTNGFVKKYCVETKESIVCRNFVLTAAEKNDIQKTRFTISNAPKVELVNSDLGSFNENWVNKFPSAVEFVTTGCLMFFNYTTSPISVNNFKMQRLILHTPMIFNNSNSLALAKLTSMKYFELKDPQYLEYPTLDDLLLSKNTDLETVYIRGNSVESFSNKTFVNLKKLTKLNIENTRIASVSEEFLKSNTNLKDVTISYSYLSNIPLNNFFPKSVERIDFSGNKIQVITKLHFAGLNKLKYLSLSENNVNVISTDAFTNLVALEELYLNRNSIFELTRKHFTPLKALKRVNINRNSFTKLPNDIFDDLTKLQFASVQYV